MRVLRRWRFGGWGGRAGARGSCGSNSRRVWFVVMPNSQDNYEQFLALVTITILPTDEVEWPRPIKSEL